MMWPSGSHVQVLTFVLIFEYSKLRQSYSIPDDVIEEINTIAP